MKREEELTASVKAEDWENACHELIWLVGDTELFERISNAARMNAEQRPVATPQPEAEPKRWLVEETLAGGTVRWSVVEHENHARKRAAERGASVTPLYAHPPKPEATEGVTEHQYELAADRLVAAIEGELDGLCVEMDKARTIIDFVLTETFGRAPSEDFPQVPWPASDWAIDRIAELEAALKATEGGAHEKVLDGNRPLPFDRETLGRFVREAWVRWAETQPGPKPSWLVPYDDLSEADKEADRQIGEAVARWTLIGDASRAALTAKPEQTEHVDTDVLENSASLNTSQTDGREVE